MHAYREFVQRKMDERGWTQASLARASGLSTAVVSRLLTDKRDRLVQLPDDATIEGLARAFGGAETKRQLWLSVARAMHLPVDEEVRVADPGGLSDDDLLRELARRLTANRGAGGARVVHFPDIDDYDEKAALIRAKQPRPPEDNEPR